MVTTPGVLDPADPGARSWQLLLQTWCGSAPRRGPSANGYDAWCFESCGPGRKILAAAAQTWCGSAPRRGPSANGYDAWRFGSCGPGRKILAAAAADLVWVCAPPRTIRKWLRSLAFWIQRTRAQDPCSCCCRPGVGLRPAADHPQMVTTPGVLDPADPGARSWQLLLQTWCGSAPRRGPSANGYDAWCFESCGPGRKILAAAAQTWCGSAPRRGPSANGYDAWRFGSCGPGRKILAAAAADLVWVCAPPRTIRKWLRSLAFWIQRTRAQDPCSCCCRPGVGLRPAADHPQMVTTPGVLNPADPGASSLQLLLDISDKSG